MKDRILSIDIFRALTMLLMIFVNDLWTLHDIPAWLEHTTADEDGMGLADVVFPAFLFIVGLSIPFAIKARINRGGTKAGILLHILRRTLALVLMGFFMVNSENFRSDLTQTFRTFWEVLMILAFILIWNNYDGGKAWGKIPVLALQVSGALLLLLLALFYKGGTPEDPTWMMPHWWGILGLIGWAYLLCSVVYLFAGDRIWIILACLIVLHILNVQEIQPFAGVKGFRIMVSASNHALVMNGMLVTGIYLSLKKNAPEYLFPVLLMLMAVISTGYGFAVRPLGGISKILATPSWTAICAGISMATFAVIYIITDIQHTSGWARPIMPAGRSTLTCYLLPGLIYPILWPLQQLLPGSLLGGWPGLVKSFLFSLLIIMLTGLLERIKIRLKI